jgi:hypothetical protein
MNWIRGRRVSIPAKILIPSQIPLDNPKARGLVSPLDDVDQAMIDYAMSLPNQHPTMLRLFGNRRDPWGNRDDFGF